jgi:two-component system, LytTR family, response regulator LytT
MKILIVEDEAVIAESLYQVLNDLGYEPMEPAFNSLEAIEIIEKHTPKLALVDIHIGSKFSGFEVAKVLNKKKIPFVFVTALYDKETVNKAKDFSPAGYLVKPFNKENLFTTIEMAMANYQPKQKNNAVLPEQVFVKNGSEIISILPKDITYIESANGYININILSGKKHLIKSSLHEIIEQLKIPTLIQVHRSFIINTLHIKAVKYDELLINDTMVPIGRMYRVDLKEKLFNS